VDGRDVTARAQMEVERLEPVRGLDRLL